MKFGRYHCSAVTKTGKRCRHKGSLSLNGKMFCKVHFDMAIHKKDDIRTTKRQEESTCLNCPVFKKAQTATRVFTSVCAGRYGVSRLQEPLTNLREEVFKKELGE